MGFFSGGNSKSKTENTAYNIANYGAENGGPTQTIAGVSASGKNSAITLNTTDFGSVSGGLALANNALQSNQSAFGSALNAVSSQASQVADNLLKVTQQTQVSQASQLQSTALKLTLIAATAFVLYRWVK